LLTPWQSSFPSRVRTVLDRIYAQTSGYLPENSDVGSAAGLPGLTIDLVTASDLLQLHRHIEHVRRFRSYLSRSIRDVRDALSRCEGRYSMHKCNGDITLIMKSRGDGSPLVESIGVDEEWPENDPWGMPVSSMPRRKLQGNKVANRLSSGFDSSSGKPDSDWMRKVAW
jgi:hypothetical protein